MKAAANRREVAALVREASDALSRIWRIARPGSWEDPELERVAAGMVLAAESHLWEARATLDRLIAEDEEVDE